MIESVRIREQALDVVELMTAEVNAVQSPTLNPHAADCRSSNALQIDPPLKRCR